MWLVTGSMLSKVIRSGGRSACLETTESRSGGPARMRWKWILRTTIKKESMARSSALPPVHPGEILREDVLPELGLSVTATAKALGVSRQMVHDILAAKKPLSAVMCLKISRLFGSTPEFWMRLQADYDLKIAARDKKVMRRVARIVPMKTIERVSA